MSSAQPNQDGGSCLPPGNLCKGGWGLEVLGWGELQLPEGSLTQEFRVQEFMSDTRAGRCLYRDVPSSTGLGARGAHQQSPHPTDTTLCWQEGGTLHRAGGGIGHCPVPPGQQAVQVYLPEAAGAATLGKRDLGL